jgi:hypothetical protein
MANPPPSIDGARLQRLRRLALKLLVVGLLGLLPLGAAVLWMRQTRQDSLHQGTGNPCSSPDDCAPPTECVQHYRGVGYPLNKSTCEIGCDSTGPNTCPAPMGCVKMSSGPMPAVGDGICAD